MEGEADTPAVIVYASSAAGIPEEETTWATLLQRAGYKTGAFGNSDILNNFIQLHF